MGKGAIVKGYLKNLSTNKIKKFLFNPSTVNTKRTVGYAVLSSPGCSYPKFQYLDGGQKTISFELFLHGTKGEVQSYITFLEGLLPKEDSSAKFKKPPEVLFAFGNFIDKCILLDIDIGYEAYRVKDKELVPTQAKVKLNLVAVK